MTEQRQVIELQFNWASKLIGYHFKIQYRPKTENRAADALSRKVNFATITTVNVKGLVDWTEEVHSDAHLQKIIQDFWS